MTDSNVRQPTPAAVWRDRLLIAAICLLGLRLAGVGLFDEGAVSLDGDMPRYLMNGVFLHDLVHDFPWRAPLTYAQHYYARYPALSLGHHPILPALALVPLFSAFGVSVFAARLSVLAALVLGLVFWFRLVRSIYDTPTAAFASFLLLTMPGFVALYRVVLSEPYTLALILASLYAMHRYGETGDRRYAIAFAASVIMSAYSKHLAVFMFPVYAFQYARVFGARQLVARSTLLTVAIIGVCLLPLVPLTLKYSQFNVMLIARTYSAGEPLMSSTLSRLTSRFISGPFAISPLLLSIAGIAVVAAAVRRDSRVLLPLIWIGSVYVALIALGARNDRFSVFWLPAFPLLGASLLAAGNSTVRRSIVAVVLAGTVAYQWSTMGEPDAAQRGPVRLAGATGYEEAAALVTGTRHGPTVLYNAAVDSGYFTFFVRKLRSASDQDVVVIRADKLLTTSRMARLAFETHVASPDEILPLIRRYGVGYVVLEDGVRYPDGPLRWLNEIATTDAFELVRRIPLQSSDLRLRGASLAIYRYRGVPAVEPDAYLSINVPAMGEQIGVRLSDLIQ